jgi:O-antigen/teichoic acid export membrane protein
MNILSQKTTIGILWNFSEKLIGRGIGLITTLLLAYFLTPDAYGLMAMVAVFIAISSSLMDLGFREALIRMKDVTQEDLSTAFYANLILGIIGYLALYFSAPYIAIFYNETQLIKLIQIIGLIVLINAFEVVHVAIFHRQMNFKVQLIVRLPAAVISACVAIGSAYWGAGVWALVAQMLISALISVALIWWISDWRPSKTFSILSFRSIYNFSYKLFLAGILDTIFKNLYIIVIAKLFSASIAGLYFFAEKMRELVLNQLVSAIQNVTYPALASIQDDNVRLKAGYRKVISITTFLLFPVLMFLAALAQPLFDLLLPEKWWPATPYFQLLCLSGLLYPLHSINLNILKVKGRSDLFLYLEILKKFIIVAILCISYRYGIIGILIGQIISSVLSYIPNSFFSEKLINYPVREQMEDFMPALILSLLIGTIIFYTTQHIEWHPTIILFVFGLSGGLLYLFSAYLLKISAYNLVHDAIKSKVKR